MCLLYTHVNIVNQSMTVWFGIYCDYVGNCRHELSFGSMAVAWGGPGLSKMIKMMLQKFVHVIWFSCADVLLWVFSNLALSDDILIIDCARTMCVNN